MSAFVGISPWFWVAGFFLVATLVGLLTRTRFKSLVMRWEEARHQVGVQAQLWAQELGPPKISDTQGNGWWAWEIGESETWRLTSRRGRVIWSIHLKRRREDWPQIQFQKRFGRNQEEATKPGYSALDLSPEMASRWWAWRKHGQRLHVLPKEMERLLSALEDLDGVLQIWALRHQEKGLILEWSLAQGLAVASLERWRQKMDAQILLWMFPEEIPPEEDWAARDADQSSEARE
jgi:hypothetical protein